MLRWPLRLIAMTTACGPASGTQPLVPSPAAKAPAPRAAHNAHQRRDSIVYHLSPLSRLEVRTGKAGLLGFAGHEHTIRARGFSGHVVYFPDEPTASRVEIRIPTDSLEVTAPPDTAEIRKVTEAMRSEVLHVDSFPEILFASRSLAARDGGFRMSATLTMHGQAQTVPLDVRVGVGRDTLRASATFTVKQTDFGITPFRGGPAGTVRVADRVTFEIAAVAIRREER
jgi:polyisoprenoid-binding protein YceI